MVSPFLVLGYKVLEMNRTVGVHMKTPHSAASLYTLSHHPGGTHYRMSATGGIGFVFESSLAWHLGYFRIVPSPCGLFGIMLAS
jgi:hypothetical protein